MFAIIMLQYTAILVKKVCMYGVRSKITMNLHYDDLAIVSTGILMYDYIILFGVIMIQDSSLFR